MRAGWGIVVLKAGELKVAWRMHGSCSDVYPSVLRAELEAVLNVLRVAIPPVRIHVDNAEVVKGFQLGEAWCLEPGRDGGELWKEVWVRMGDMEGEVEVIKVKAHTKEEEVEEGVVTERDRFGNLHADAEAKRGARLAESLSPVGSARSELLKALRWTSWARRFAAIWKPDVREVEAEEGGRDIRGEGAGPKQGTGLRHLVWEKGTAWRCRRCGRLADTEQKRRDMRSSRCLGSAVGRMLSRACEDPSAVARACVERRSDLSSRGWRAKEGGGDDTGYQERAAREFDEEREGSSSSEEEKWREEGEQESVQHPGREEPSSEGHGAAAEVAEASACGSASATAGRPEGGLAGGASGRAAAVVGRVGDGDHHRGSDGLARTPRAQLPFTDFPELPEQEARAVLAERAVGAGAPVSHHSRTEAQLDQVGRLTQRGGKRAAALTQPAAKQRRADVSQVGARPHIEAVQPSSSSSAVAQSSVPDLGLAEEAHQELFEYGFPEEDPFGYIAEELAAQPPLAMPLRAGSEARGGVGFGVEVADEGPAALAQRPSGGHQEERSGHARHELDLRRRRQLEAPLAEGDHPEIKRRRRGLEPEMRLDVGAGAADESDTGQPASSVPEGAAAADEVANRPRFGRRYTGVVADPVDAAASRGHRLEISGPLVYCSRCGRYAARRVGRALRGGCVGEATGAYATRLARMRAGRHPLTGADLVA